MAVRYDPLLAARLAWELRERYARRSVAAVGLGPDGWTAALAFGDGSTLWCFLHPQAGQIVPDAHSPLASLLADRSQWRRALRRGMVRAGGWRWHVFRHLVVQEIETPPDERLLLLALSSGGSARARLALELPRNRRNALLLEPARIGERAPESSGRDAPWSIRDVLRPGPARHAPGQAYREPRSRRSGAVEPLSLSEWTDCLSSVGPEDRRAEALQQIALTSALNIDYILTGGSIPDSEEDAAGPSGQVLGPRSTLAAAYARYLEVRQEARCHLLPRPWGLQPYTHRLGDAAAVPIETLLAGMVCAAAAGGVAPPSPAEATPSDTADLRGALQRRHRRLCRRRNALRARLSDAQEADRLREAGHLILANVRNVRRGATSVDLPDFEGSRRTITLDPALGPAENAERYYRRAARQERAAQRLPADVEALDREIAEIEAGLDRLGSGAEPDADLLRLAGFRDRRTEPRRAAQGAGGGPPPGRIPFRRYRTSGGLEVRVGRSSKDNDALTFKHASPDDIWLHARQAPGAHVVLRWGRRDQNPPERDLREAAVLAAVHSDARHSGVVAVDWTRRKYVRKPRRAAAGAVTAERLRTLFVEPDEAAAQRLRFTT
jgi:hypothetical protein